MSAPRSPARNDRLVNVEGQLGHAAGTSHCCKRRTVRACATRSTTFPLVVSRIMYRNSSVLDATLKRFKNPWCNEGGETKLIVPLLVLLMPPRHLWMRYVIA